ncbi:uncharacterized protein LOC126741053 [Anthonomus grandis grandis]|uniref:uncharacterized protein LOC126741053 n=1 Tax=Anthonomus grandis grandis TaxID=2921223 RepID=UPI0021659CBD|nr:uncharacterized protein LOC126741053 [Anthonomus grandis grandis]
MKTLMLFTLFTWASSVPLGWSPTGNWYNQQPIVPGLGSQLQWNNLSPAQKASYEIAHQIEVAEAENVNKVQQAQPTNWVNGEQWKTNILAHQAAQEVLKNAVEARQGQTVESIVDIEKQLQQNVLGVPQPLEQVVAAKAINGLNKKLQLLQMAKESILPTSQLSQSLEAAIAAQLVSDNVEVEMEHQGHSLGNVRQPSGVFRSRVEQLIDQTNIEEIEMEIVNQLVIIKQLQQQKQFTSQQLEVIVAELVVLQKQGASINQLQQLHQAQLQLQQQEKQLVVNILARQQVVQQLKQALVEQQINLQHNIMAEHAQPIQKWSVDPWSQSLGQNVPSWRLSPWSRMGSIWKQGNWIN